MQIISIVSFEQDLKCLKLMIIPNKLNKVILLRKDGLFLFSSYHSHL